MDEQTKEQQPTEHPAAWALLELFGHKRMAGRVSVIVIADVKFLRVEVPNEDGNGFKVVDEISPKAVYRLRHCTEEVARAAAKVIPDSPPVHDYELHALPAGEPCQPVPFRDPDYPDDGDPDLDDEDPEF